MKIVLFLILAPFLFAAVFFLCGVISSAVLLYRRPIRSLYQKRAALPDFCSLEQVSDKFVEFLLLAEDDMFYRHNGISIPALRTALRLFVANRTIIIGGSTITQQLIKNLYFEFHPTAMRKLTEMIMALAIEKILSKQEIFTFYINIIYYGCGNYGIYRASEYYFHKPAKELDFSQSFLLTRILNGPTFQNPLMHPDVYRKFRDLRVANWKRRGILSEKEAELLLSYPPEKPDPELREPTDEPQKFVRAPWINERFGPQTDFK